MATRTIARPRLQVGNGEQKQSVPSRSVATSSLDLSVPPRSASPVQLQRHALAGGPDEEHMNVQLLIDGSDADGIRQYDETLPLSLIRAILDPTIADFFIPIAGRARPKAPAARQHYLHTSYIREVILLGDLPPEEE